MYLIVETIWFIEFRQVILVVRELFLFTGNTGTGCLIVAFSIINVIRIRTSFSFGASVHSDSQIFIVFIKMVGCSIRNCKSRSIKGGKISFFSFPQTLSVANEWLRYCGPKTTAKNGK